MPNSAKYAGKPFNRGYYAPCEVFFILQKTICGGTGNLMGPQWQPCPSPEAAQRPHFAHPVLSHGGPVRWKPAFICTAGSSRGDKEEKCLQDCQSKTYDPIKVGLRRKMATPSNKREVQMWALWLEAFRRLEKDTVAIRFFDLKRGILEYLRSLKTVPREELILLAKGWRCREWNLPAVKQLGQQCSSR